MLRLNAGAGAASSPDKKSNFLNPGCYKTAEILFDAATNHLLAMFAHVGPKKPSASLVKSKEKQIKFNSLMFSQHFVIYFKKCQKKNLNQQAEEKVILAGAEKESTSSRKRLAYKISDDNQRIVNEASGATNTNKQENTKSKHTQDRKYHSLIHQDTQNFSSAKRMNTKSKTHSKTRWSEEISFTYTSRHTKMH